MDELRFAVVGVGGRADSLVESLPEYAVVHAVCDIDEDLAAAKGEAYGASEASTDYEAVLDDEALDAVVVATPQHLHAPQARRALERGKHVFSEVPAAVTEEQARELVAAAAGSGGQYMLGENAIYFPENQTVGALVEAGLFGDLYFGRGEYIHDLKRLPERTPWRREWQLGVNGISYPTHQLGPLLEWFGDDRVQRVSCEGSGHHYTDPEGREYELEDTTLLVGKTERGRMVEIRQDMISNRPHQPRAIRHALQGTRGSYETAVAGTDTDRLWLADRHETDQPHEREFAELDTVADEYLPDDRPETPLADFAAHVRAGEPVPIGVHDAMDMTLPGLASAESIEADGVWVDVPDSRTW